MQVDIVRDHERLQEIKNMWDEILFSSEQDCIFFTHEWISSWWECLSEDNSLEILLFNDKDGNSLGIAPFMVKDGILRFIGSQEVSDYCDVIASKGREEEFYENLLNYFKVNYSSIKRIELMNIKHSSPTLAFLPRLAPKQKFSCSLAEIEVAPLLVLPSSYDEYLKGLSKKRRHELRRKLRRMESLNKTTVKKVTDTQHLKSSVKNFIAFHEKSNPSKAEFWKRKGMSNFFQEIAYRFSLQKWVELSFLCHEGQTMAALFNFSYSDEIYFYNVAYSREFACYSPGIYLFNHCIQQAISEGKRKADFLRGREEYKYYFGAKDSKIFHLVLTPEKNER